MMVIDVMAVSSQIKTLKSHMKSLVETHIFTSTFVCGFIFSAVINLLLLSMPLYSLQLFSRVIPSGNLNTLAMLTIIVVIALSIMALLEGVRTCIFSRAGNRLEVAYRHRLLADAVDATARGRPDATPLADLTEVRSFLSRPTFAALNDLPWMPLYVVVIYLIHPLLAILMIVGSLLLILFAFLSHWATQGLSECNRSAAGRSARMLDALHSRVDLLRALSMRDTAITRWQRDNLTSTAYAGMMAERGGVFGSWIKWVRYLLQVAVSGVGAALVIDNHLSLGGMIATSMLVGRAMAPLEQLSAALVPTWKSIRAWSRLHGHVRRLGQARSRQAGAPIQGRLTAENVLYISPHDQKPILKSLSFDLTPGETLCIYGPNRSGKSTLGRILCGALKPHAGSVRIGGQDISAWYPEDPRDGIGYMPQHAEPFPGTIGEMIARFVPDCPEETIATARWAGVHDLVSALPNGYETDVSEMPGLMTGGTERLLALARAGFGRPPLLVLDEPIANLDIAGVEQVRKALVDVKQRGITIVILSQATAFLDLADRVMVIANGAITAFGPRDQVIGPIQGKARPLPAAQIVS